MQKILIIGCSGAGKSTFARRLQSLTGLPLYYLDRLWHRPDRTNVTREAFDAALAGLLTRPAWIIDGDYSRTLQVRLEACDTVFFLDYPLDVCLAGVEDRRGCLRPDMPWVEEELDAEFLQYILDFGRDQLPIVTALLERYRGRRKIITFHSRAEADNYLNALAVTLRPYRPEDCPALPPVLRDGPHCQRGPLHPGAAGRLGPRRRSGPRRLGRELPGAPDPCSRAGRKAGRLWGHGHRLRLPGPAVRP